MALTREEIQHIATLARIDLREEEIEKFRDQLSSILDYVKKLQDADTPMVDGALRGVMTQNVLRQDRVQVFSEQGLLVEAAPGQEGKWIKVKAVLK